MAEFEYKCMNCSYNEIHQQWSESPFDTAEEDPDAVYAAGESHCDIHKMRRVFSPPIGIHVV